MKRREELRLQTARVDLKWTSHFGNDSQLNLSVNVNHHTRMVDAQRLAQTQTGQLALSRKIQSDAVANTLGTLGKYTHPLSGAHALSIGWDLEYSRRREQRQQTDLTSADLRNNSLPVDTLRLDQDFESDVMRSAFYVQDEWSIDPKWSVYWGMRWEQILTHSKSDFSPQVSNRSRVLSPSLQILRRLPEISKNDQIRLALSRTYRAPTAGNLMNLRTLSLNNSIISTDTQGNPDLRPELAWGLDLAYEHYFGKNGLLSASLYLRRIEDVMSSSLTNIDGRWVTSPINSGRARSHGVELEAKFPLKEIFSNAPEIEVKANLNRNWSVVDSVPGPDNRARSTTSTERQSRFELPSTRAAMAHRWQL